MKLRSSKVRALTLSTGLATALIAASLVSGSTAEGATSVDAGLPAVSPTIGFADIIEAVNPAVANIVRASASAWCPRWPSCTALHSS